MRFFISFLTLTIAILFFHNSIASMSSTNYSITSSVISGGGAPMSSENFQSDSTLGQSSAIQPSDSTNYELNPGFWHTMTQSIYIWDFEPDGDVDGMDLIMFIEGYGGTSGSGYDDVELENFSLELGSHD